MHYSRRRNIMQNVNSLICFCKKSRSMPLFAVSSFVLIIYYVEIGALSFLDLMGIFAYWLGTFLYFSLIDKVFCKKPRKLVGLTVLFLVFQIPIFGLMQYFYLDNLFDLTFIALVPIELVYLPNCMWRCIALLWKKV